MRTLLIFLAWATLLVPARSLRATEAAPAVAFPGAQGNYGGEIAGSPDGINGALVVVLGASGQFSANLNWQNVHYPFTGNFDPGTATFTRNFDDRTASGTTLVLSLTLNAASRTIDAALEVQAGGYPTTNASGQLSGAIPDRAASHAYSGTMNTCFINPPSYGITGGVSGDGFSIARIATTKGNAMRIVGRLPDTEPFAAGSVLRGTDYSITAGLYHRGHSFGGQAQGVISASDPSSLTSTIFWVKLAGFDPNYYPGGITSGFGLVTGTYKSVTLLSLPHISITPGPIRASLALTYGNLEENNVYFPVTAQIKIGFFGVRVLGPNPQHIVVTANAAAGTWAGSFIHPISGRRTNFHGGFTEVRAGMNGEGRGNFKGSVPPASADLPESGSARITVN